MKKTLLIACLFGTTFTFGQSFTQANEPVIGDAQTMFLCDPTAPNYESTTGTGVTWDYSTVLSVGGQDRDVTIEDATQDPNFSSFPGSVKTIKVENALTTFYNSSTTERSSQGFVYYEVTFGEVIATFDSDEEKLMDYPFANGNSLTDTYAGMLSFDFNGIPQNPTASGNAYAWVDGQGELIQPNGVSVTDVIRYKFIDTSYATLALFGNLEIVRTQYEYYDITNERLPLLTHSSVIIQQPGGGAPLTDQVIVLSKEMPSSGNVSVDETETFNFVVYPNPTSDEVIVKGDFDGDASISIADFSGRIIETLPLSSEMIIDLSTYDTGMYLLKLTSNGSSTTKTVVKR